MINFNDEGNSGWKVQQSGSKIIAEKSNVFGSEKFEEDISEFKGVEIKHFRRSGKRKSDSDSSGYKIWLVHQDKDKTVPVYSSQQGNSIHNFGKSDLILEVRAVAEHFAKELNLPLLVRKNESDYSVIQPEDLDKGLKELIDSSDIKIDPEVFSNRKLKWNFHGDRVEITRDTTLTALIYFIVFLVIDASIYFIFHFDQYILYFVIFFMGLIILIMGSIKEHLTIYRDRFEYKSQGQMGLVKNEAEISVDVLENIQIEKNPGLNGSKALCFISDEKMFYFGSGLKTYYLKDLSNVFKAGIKDFSIYGGYFTSAKSSFS